MKEFHFDAEVMAKIKQNQYTSFFISSRNKHLFVDKNEFVFTFPQSEVNVPITCSLVIQAEDLQDAKYQAEIILEDPKNWNMSSDIFTIQEISIKYMV